MSVQNRTKNSFINIAVAISGQGISILVSFVTRIIFIRRLGEVYLGVNSLFTNIVGLLSLAELGVGTAINYSLYKPLAEDDTEKIKSLMLLYKKVYYFIGVLIFIAGLILLPFLKYFMKSSEMEMVSNIYVIFILFVVNSSVSYFYSFKRELIISDQKRYIATIYRYFFYVIMNVAQIIALLVTNNFVVYLLITLFCTTSENICISLKADKMYPYLKETKIIPLRVDDTNLIKKNTFALLFHKVGSSVVNSTDNILISKIIGIVSVGIFSNYQLITSALNIVIAQFFMALTASIGNIGVTEANEKSERIFYNIFFLNFWIDTIISTSLYATVNLLVEAWFGREMVLESNILICVVMNFYLYHIRRTVWTYRDAYGLFWYDRYKALVEAAVNLIVSVFLGIKMGIAGIILGTIISTVTTSLWVEPYILFKYAFKKKPYHYYKILVLYIFVTAGCCLLCKFMVDKMQLSGFIGFLLGVLICMITVSVLITVCFFRCEEYQYILHLPQRIFIMLTRKRGKNNA